MSKRGKYQREYYQAPAACDVAKSFDDSFATSPLVEYAQPILVSYFDAEEDIADPFESGHMAVVGSMLPEMTTLILPGKSKGLSLLGRKVGDADALNLYRYRTYSHPQSGAEGVWEEHRVVHIQRANRPAMQGTLPNHRVYLLRRFEDTDDCVLEIGHVRITKGEFYTAVDYYRMNQISDVATFFLLQRTLDRAREYSRVSIEIGRVAQTPLLVVSQGFDGVFSGGADGRPGAEDNANGE